MAENQNPSPSEGMHPSPLSAEAAVAVHTLGELIEKQALQHQGATDRMAGEPGNEDMQMQTREVWLDKDVIARRRNISDPENHRVRQVWDTVIPGSRLPGLNVPPHVDVSVALEGGELPKVSIGSEDVTDPHERDRIVRGATDVLKRALQRSEMDLPAGQTHTYNRLQDSISTAKQLYGPGSAEYDTELRQQLRSSFTELAEEGHKDPKGVRALRVAMSATALGASIHVHNVSDRELAAWHGELRKAKPFDGLNFDEEQLYSGMVEAVSTIYAPQAKSSWENKYGIDVDEPVADDEDDKERAFMLAVGTSLTDIARLIEQGRPAQGLKMAAEAFAVGAAPNAKAQAELHKYIARDYLASVPPAAEAPQPPPLSALPPPPGEGS